MDRRELEEIISKKIPEIVLEESFPKIMDFNIVTKYMLLVKIEGKPFPLNIDIDNKQPSEVRFYAKRDCSEPSLMDYDLDLSGENATIPESFINQKKKFFKVLAHCRLHVSVITNVRFYYGSPISKQFGKHDVFSSEYQEQLMKRMVM